MEGDVIVLTFGVFVSISNGKIKRMKKFIYEYTHIRVDIFLGLF